MGTPAGDGEVGRLVHKIHTAQVVDGQDFTGITYPQDIRNCTKCHKGGADSDNWKTKPTIAICGSCHSTVDFSSGLNHTGGPQPDNSTCAGTGCHTPAEITGFHIPVAAPDPNNIYSVPVTGNTNTNAAYLAATGVLPVGAHRITYVINSVSAVSDAAISPSKRPSITFKLQDNAVDVVFDTYSAGVTTDIMPNFAGSPSVYFAWAVPQDNIATPADFNASASGYIKKIWDGTATGSGAGVLTGPDANGYYTITLTGVSVPANAVMFTGGVGYTYSLSSTPPLTQVNLPAYPYDVLTRVGGLIVPAPNVWKVGAGFTGRRIIVDTAKCNTCHDGLGVAPTFHAGQRNDAPTCSFCHNPNRTSGSGWSDNAGTLVHGIHAAAKRTVPYTWSAANSGVNTYPGVLNDCEQCHVPGGYDYSGGMYTGTQTVSNMLMTTSATGKYDPNPIINSAYFTVSPYVVADGVTDYGNGFSFNAATGVTIPAAATTLVESPVTAVCVSCHDSSAVLDHMTSSGGSFYAARSAAMLKAEQCLICHGPGSVASIKDVHSK
jgi:OmcA/MtrC family decaheme c-type cytochrome